MLQIPQRLLSVRNKTYLLSPLPPRKRPISAQISRVTLGFVAIGSCLVMGYSAMVLASLFNTPSKGELASNTPSGSPTTLPPIASGAGSTPSPTLTTPGSQPLLSSTNANQRTNQVITGRPNPFTSVRELSVLLPGQVKWNKPKPLVKTPVISTKQLALAPRTSTPFPSKTPGLGLTPLPPQEIPATPTLPVPNFNTPAPESLGRETPPPAYPSGVNPVASTLACDVQINGVVQTNGEPMVVLKIKSEENAYPRVVQVGERICNGSVAVSQVIGLGGAQPTVVLDQYGQSIYKPVENTLVPPPKT